VTDENDDSADHKPREQRDQDNPDRKDDGKDNKNAKPKSRLPIIIAIVIAVIAIIAFVIYYLATMGEVTTDDAYTDGNAVSMASNVSGYVTQLNIDDNSFVHKGQLLLTIDPRPDQASFAQAKANLALAQSEYAAAQINLVETRVKAPAQLQQAQAQLVQAQAQAHQMQLNYARELSVDQRATSANDVTQAHEQLRSAEASVAQAQAQVNTASLVPQMIADAQAQVRERAAQLGEAEANYQSAAVELSYNYIRAPADGWITMRNVDLGTYVQAGQQAFYLVTAPTWVTANFKETQLTHIRIGDRVTMTVDAYPYLKLRGHVQSVQEGSGARFSEFPAQNATGNFVKIVRRVPVKIVIDSGLPPGALGLPLGISVEPTVFITD
jgi:membrane fusion protein (multidrug efflux system)